jgi:hypothetical protein
VKSLFRVASIAALCNMGYRHVLAGEGGMRQVIVCALLVLAAGCRASTPEQEGERFHQLFNAGDYPGLFRTGTDQLKYESEAIFTHLVKAVHDRMGLARQANLRGVRRFEEQGHHLVVLYYDTQFERGAGREAITYRVMDGDRLLLDGYEAREPRGGPHTLMGNDASFLEEMAARAHAAPRR